MEEVWLVVGRASCHCWCSTSIDSAVCPLWINRLLRSRPPLRHMERGAVAGAGRLLRRLDAALDHVADVEFIAWPKYENVDRCSFKSQDFLGQLLRHVAAFFYR